jgi:hypothetical protein
MVISLQRSWGGNRETNSPVLDPSVQMNVRNGWYKMT